jgi:hypothetical protein
MTTLITRRHAVSLFALSIALAGLAGPSHARERGPVARTVKASGKDAAANFEWEISRVELSGLKNPLVQRRINAALRQEGEQARRAMLAELADWEVPEGFDGSHGLWIGMEVGAVTPRLLSVSITTSTYYAGAAHPNSGVHTLTFDLRTGNKVPTRGLFRPGAAVMDRVAQKVDAALRASGEYATDGEYYLETVTAENIRAVRVEKDGGLTFFFGSYEIGPYAAGMPQVTVSAAELSGLLATDGAAGATFAAAASRGLAGSVPADAR